MNIQNIPFTLIKPFNSYSRKGCIAVTSILFFLVWATGGLLVRQGNYAKEYSALYNRHKARLSIISARRNITETAQNRNNVSQKSEWKTEETLWSSHRINNHLEVYIRHTNKDYIASQTSVVTEGFTESLFTIERKNQSSLPLNAREKSIMKKNLERTVQEARKNFSRLKNLKHHTVNELFNDYKTKSSHQFSLTKGQIEKEIENALKNTMRNVTILLSTQ